MQQAEFSFEDVRRSRRLRCDSPTYLRRLEAWRKFDDQHPEVYTLFCQMARQAQARRPRYSARTILEVMRWNFMLNEDGDGGFKLNDHFSPFYVRKLIDEDTTFSEFFELRGEDEDE